MHDTGITISARCKASWAKVLHYFTLRLSMTLWECCRYWSVQHLLLSAFTSWYIFAFVFAGSRIPSYDCGYLHHLIPHSLPLSPLCAFCLLCCISSLCFSSLAMHSCFYSLTLCMLRQGENYSSTTLSCQPKIRKNIPHDTPNVINWPPEDLWSVIKITTLLHNLIALPACWFASIFYPQIPLSSTFLSPFIYRNAFWWIMEKFNSCKCTVGSWEMAAVGNVSNHSLKNQDWAHTEANQSVNVL